MIFVYPSVLDFVACCRECSRIFFMTFIANGTIRSNFFDFLRLLCFVFPPKLILHFSKKMSKFHHSPVSPVIPFLLAIHKKLQSRISPNILPNAQIVVIYTINFPNEYRQLYFHSFSILFRCIIMLRKAFAFEVVVGAIFSCFVHNLGKGLPCRCEVSTMRAPISVKIHENKLIALQCNVECVLIQANRILSVGVQFFNRFLDCRVKQLDIMLLQIPMLKPLFHPACINRIFLYMLRHILLRSQNANYIDRGEFTLQIHHGDVEIDANVGVLIGIESEGST
mmetsp:Transcript_19482/g.39910  ORF Transcript_19482/g.39910 Transcript_19482/m.39910 type:complete len:281 (+) Transcript_19482:879-1721(+)